jgi:ribosomal protein L37AE/L43A
MLLCNIYVKDKHFMARVKQAYYACRECGDNIEVRRVQLGYRLCMSCGEEAAQADRKRWTVSQEYNKGGYMFITAAAASITMKQINPKEQRV